MDIYYRLATLFLGRERYVDAKIYYDSTLTVMQKSDDRYSIASRYAGNLSSIAKNISIITKNDSLLKLSYLPEEELWQVRPEIRKLVEFEQHNLLKRPPVGKYR